MQASVQVEGTSNVQNMTTQEVADLTRTPVETVRYWRYIGKGPRHFKIGRRVLYAAGDVEAWLAHAREAGSG